MPLVKIDITKGTRTPEQIKSLADTIQQVMLDKFGAPYRDRYQIITQHEPYEIICEDTDLGFTRSQDLVFIQIFQQGRSVEQKQSIYQTLYERLNAEFGLSGHDLIVSCAENTKADWSFGMGEAQFLTGGLPRPN
ncbi:Tautomerase/MIF [Aspergillus heteromorphus CBS 117.55]|uniref:Tautomerase/MIF n=1 Tax=Aspergillus heteromorphus CBS 117.55 TaxID=1448321 RepID=A0A317WHC4_9EURO|nr:Tautomerase/MIF [Aspergillus heteromorphus CBS 117.55]PWY83600.1 Tautomerase/MIF [Aspergillus heteromorphus CBS 117.55]